MPYIKVIQPQDAEGELKDIYEGLEKSRGKLAEVHKIQSLHPKGLVKHLEFYMELMFGKSPLKRYQREMIAVVVSAANQCEYCIAHHSAALNHFWKDDIRLESFIKDFRYAGLTDGEVLLCEYAWDLTRSPNSINQDKAGALKSVGFADEAILSAVEIVGYFNFVNRMVLGLGVHLELDKGEGYNYD